MCLVLQKTLAAPKGMWQIQSREPNVFAGLETYGTPLASPHHKVLQVSLNIMKKVIWEAPWEGARKVIKKNSIVL